MNTRLWSLGFALVVSSACGEQASRPGDDSAQARGALGKADLVGSCESQFGDHCGGKSFGNCWCDDACVGYGDCCSDVDEVCGIEPPPPEGQPCGGFLGDTCTADEYCAYEPGQHCGAADASALCEPRPDVCIELLQPVCGCDGNTYSNSCYAAAAGTGVLTEGECDPPPTGGFCGGIAGFPCPEGQVCVDDPSDDCDPQQGGADCGGICELEETCPPVLCELFCPFGLATDPETGCETCSCADQPVNTECSAAGGQCLLGLIIACPEGLEVSSLSCGNTNIETVCCAPEDPEPVESCEGLCGGSSDSGACWCDDLCGYYGDCCSDADEWCQIG